jgi:hypothetical protein
MLSDNQLPANRLDSQRSAGPRTPEGEARAALNSDRRDLLVRNTAIFEEERAPFLALLAALEIEHQPVGPEETFLVEHIAWARFRRQRLNRIETGLYMIDMDKMRERDLRDTGEADPPPPTPLTPKQAYDRNTRRLARVFREQAGGDALRLLARYEAATLRTLNWALKMLLELQTRRTPPPPPVKRTPLPKPNSPSPIPAPPVQAPPPVAAAPVARLLEFAPRSFPYPRR